MRWSEFNAQFRGRMSDPIDCPALHVRRIDKGYPFGDRVPKTVRMVRRATTDAIVTLATRETPLVAEYGETYPAWTNSYGAVCAVMPDGKHLGLYPCEFEVVEWTQCVAARCVEAAT